MNGHSYLFLIFLVYYSIVSLADRTPDKDDFADHRNTIHADNPVRKASYKVAYGTNPLQPYYICDDPASPSALPLPAWHYSCTQLCSDANAKSHVNITRATWHFRGKDVPTYKVTTNEVCYTAHENLWGSCQQSQTVTPVATVAGDRAKIPKEFLSAATNVGGVKTVVNSGPASCEYFSDNTNCARDYVITYRPGKTTRLSENSPILLNIYGDGIRVDPGSGVLIQNDAAWFWEPLNPKTTECGWELGELVTCRLTNSSEVLSCPDIGYQYNVKTIRDSTTCVGSVYDINGPAPFMYVSSLPTPNKEELAEAAMKGKGEPDVNLIIGVNKALEQIEETYCSAACDLFSRGQPADDDHVLNTPMGTWRLANANTTYPIMVPCQPTMTWSISPTTTMCHGKNHLLVEDSVTHKVCSWDTLKDYITVTDQCMNSQAEMNSGVESIRKQMSRHQDIKIEFWTGDRLIVGPPYETLKWENFSTNYSRSPSWFSKVQLKANMLRGKDDISSQITKMVSDMKQEIAYNKTSVKSIKSVLFDEMISGVGSAGGKMMKAIIGLLTSVPKAIIVITIALVILWLLRAWASAYLMSRVTRNIGRSVTFPDTPIQEELIMKVPQGPTKRPRGRARQLAYEAEALGI